MSVFYFRKESDLIYHCAKKIQHFLGNCLTKDIYMDALELEFAKAGLRIRREAPVPVYYEEDGEEPVRLAHLYTADFVVEDKILVAVKAEGNTGRLDDYALQTLLYATRMNLAILLQFRDKQVQINRVCRYSRFLNSRNIDPKGVYTGRWEEKNVVLTGAGASD